MVRNLGKRARVNPDVFRHAFAREFVLNGRDIGTESRIVGQAQITVTKQFCAMFSTEELKEAQERFTRAFPLNRRSEGPTRR